MSDRTPAFWQTISTLFQDAVAHAYLLHGNVHDYVPNGSYQPLLPFLAARLMRGFDLIIQIDPSRGMDFPLGSQHRDLAARLLGMDAPQTPPSSSIAAALGTGQEQGQSPRFPRGVREMSELVDRLLTEPLLVAEGATKRPLRAAIIFTYGELLIPDADLIQTDPLILGRLLQWARSPQVGRTHALFLVTESLLSIHAELRRASSRWEPVELSLPDAAERERFIESRLEQYGDDLALADDLSPRQVAAMTGALNLLQIEDVLMRGMGAGTLTPDLVTERKQAIIRQEFADVLDVRDPRWNLLAVGGYAYLKDFLDQRLVQPWRKGRLAMGGILMSGPPGTGKTQLAEALAGSAGVPFVVFALSKILGQYVGNSERNLERALKAILSLAPCVLFIDELDQVTNRGENGGNGVDNRVFASLLTFLEDPARQQAGVLVVAATNRPDLLDAALRSRFDRTAPVLPPTAEDREAIIRTLGQAMGLELPQGSLNEAAARTEGWVGRNLRDLSAAGAVAAGVRDGGSGSASDGSACAEAGADPLNGYGVFAVPLHLPRRGQAVVLNLHVVEGRCLAANEHRFGHHLETEVADGRGRRGVGFPDGRRAEETGQGHRGAVGADFDNECGLCDQTNVLCGDETVHPRYHVGVERRFHLEDALFAALEFAIVFGGPLALRHRLPVGILQPVGLALNLCGNPGVFGGGAVFHLRTGAGEVRDDGARSAKGLHHLVPAITPVIGVGEVQVRVGVWQARDGQYLHLAAGGQAAHGRASHLQHLRQDGVDVLSWLVANLLHAAQVEQGRVAIGVGVVDAGNLGVGDTGAVEQCPHRVHPGGVVEDDALTGSACLFERAVSPHQEVRRRGLAGHLLPDAVLARGGHAVVEHHAPPGKVDFDPHGLVRQAFGHQRVGGDGAG